MDTVRPVLQPITQNLPDALSSSGRSLLGPLCYQTLILDVDPFSSPDCMKLAVSKALGIGIIGASSIVKIPQLVKLVQSQSAHGISFLAYLLESLSYLISLSYNVRHGFPVSTYGEMALILVQNAIIAALVLHYSGSRMGAATWVAGLAAAGGVLLREDIVGFQELAWLQAAAGILGVASKAPQIWTVWRQGGTGQLSAFAVFNYLLGSLSRIFTTLQEVPDILILYGFVAGFTLNLVLALQMAWYWKAPSTTKPISLSEKRQQSGNVESTSASARGAKSPSTRRRG